MMQGRAKFLYQFVDCAVYGSGQPLTEKKWRFHRDPPYHPGGKRVGQPERFQHPHDGADIGLMKRWHEHWGSAGKPGPPPWRGARKNIDNNKTVRFINQFGHFKKVVHQRMEQEVAAVLKSRLKFFKRDNPGAIVAHERIADADDAGLNADRVRRRTRRVSVCCRRTHVRPFSSP
jgi:hypothetical protein